MNRAKLRRDDVTHIIITSTMTPVSQRTTPSLLLGDRKAEGYLDVGWHYFVDMDSVLHRGVPLSEAGSYFDRYARSAVTVLIEGGVREDGLYTNNYRPQQLNTLREVIDLITETYPHANISLHRDLFKGVNPSISIEEIYRGK